MFRNYFITALRNLWKNKFYSSINIVGLSVGLAVGIMILLWVQDELSFDSFHSKRNRIYKVNSHLGEGNSAQTWGGSPSPVALYGKSMLPEVENTVRMRDAWELSLFNYGNNKFIIPKLAYVDSSFFDVFDFGFDIPAEKHPFKDANSVVIQNLQPSNFLETKILSEKFLHPILKKILQ